MGLVLPQMVEIKIQGKANYYEKLGYEIPRRLDNCGRLRTELNATIKVHVLDLPQKSCTKVKVQCDLCGVVYEINYSDSINNTCVNKTGKLFCRKCFNNGLKQYKANVKSLKWQSKEYVLEKLDEYIKENNTLCNIRNTNKGLNLVSNIKLYNYDIELLCGELGYNYMTLKNLYYPHGYLNNFNNVKYVIEEFIFKYGYFPTTKDMMNELHIPLSIVKKFGGVYEMRRKISYNDCKLLEDDNGFYNKSHYEYIVAQFLIHNKISYLREQSPFPKPYNALRSDFTFIDMNNILYQIEIWGYELNNSKRSLNYNKQKEKKILLYRKYNIQLISIESELFRLPINKIQEKLMEIFNPYFKIGLKNIEMSNIINPYKLTDLEILNKIMQYSDNDDFLPLASVISKNEHILYNEILRRYGGITKFAKIFGKATHLKTDVWKSENILKVMNHMREKYGYVLRISDINLNSLSKKDSMLIGFEKGLKQVFNNVPSGYLFYYNYCLENKIILHEKDLQYLNALGYNGRGFNKKHTMEYHRIKARSILCLYYAMSYYDK